MEPFERGDSLVEVIVAVAVIAITLGAVLSGTVAAAHRFGSDPVQDVLQAKVLDETRIATNLLKYQGVSLTPAVIATTIPIAGASPLPAHLSLAVATTAAGGYIVTIRAQSDRDSSAIATVRTLIARPVPLPSSTVNAGSIAAPVGAQ